MQFKTDLSNPNNEKNILKNCEKDFYQEIKNRGVEYYHNNKIQSLQKNKNHYYAKVQGSDNNIYDVEIIIDLFEINYKCNCPCSYPCKHEYATILAIHNHEYTKINLKPKIKEENPNIKKIIKRIPASKLKAYLLSSQSKNKVFFEEKSFKNFFSEYYPYASYDFYYNNLYNILLLNQDDNQLINDYLSKAQNYLENQNYKQVIKIITAIINAYRDNKCLKSDILINNLPKIGMYLRITLRKCNQNDKKNIKLWLKELEENNYYKNIYLEDIIHLLKETK